MPDENAAAPPSDLQVAHDAAAEAIGAFETEWAQIEAEWDAKRREVNDLYRSAAAALEADRVAQADPNRPEAIVVEPAVPAEDGSA